MRAWIVPLVLAVAVAGAVGTYTVRLMFFAPTSQSASLSEASQEAVAGLKRWPGTWKEATIKVVRGVLPGGEPDVTIDVDVLRPVFVPSEIRVKKGQVVRLLLHGKDSGIADMPGVDEAIGLKEFSGHGFQVLGPYDIWITGIRKDVTREVTFKADVAGEFAFECVVFCHPAHYAMRGKLIVEE